MKKSILITCLLASLLTACGNETESTASKKPKTRTEEFLPIAKANVIATLSDPSSAQFRDYKIDGADFCIEVNGKNKFGGYVGFTWFVVFMIHPDTMPEDKYIVQQVSETSTRCKKT